MSIETLSVYLNLIRSAVVPRGIATVPNRARSGTGNSMPLSLLHGFRAEGRPAIQRMLLDVFLRKNWNAAVTRTITNTLRGSKNPDTKALLKEYGIR